MMITPFQKRIALFLIFCMGLRVGLVFLARYASPLVLMIMGVLAACVAVGFLSIWWFKLRETGLETNGEKIWWDALRPFHALTFAVFAYLAIRGVSEHAWKPLALDVSVGFVAFVVHHLSSSSST